MENKERRECIHCHICQEKCSFLKKYGIDIGDTHKLKDVMYHCFLCGKCTEVCPLGIDGREIILNMRKKNPVKEDHSMILIEKRNYLFKNYRHANKNSVLFPGCNFPSFYPETTKKLVKLLYENAEMGVVYDCCGKPLAELGRTEDESKIISSLNQRIQKQGIQEMVMLCPNCYSYLKTKLNAEVVSIYDKLAELGIGRKLEYEHEFEIFMPCPERRRQDMMESIKPFLPEQAKVMEDTSCCGLGGSARNKEPELAKEMASSMRGKNVYTYCASCASNFARNGCEQVHHLLVEILGCDERPDVKRAFVNRVKTKFI